MHVLFFKQKVNFLGIEYWEKGCVWSGMARGYRTIQFFF